MKCAFCKQPAGFFESYHDECYNNVMATLKKLEGVINSYNKNHIDAKKAKATLLDLVSTNRMYQNYLESQIVDMQAIRTNEIAVYEESGMRVSESKNRCKMVSTGYRYEKKPVWNETESMIGNNTTIVITDKAVYMIQAEKAMRYPYSKIVNLGYDEKWGYVYFDVKTTSPYPHRFTIRSVNRKNDKTANLCLFLNCLMRYQEE